MNKNIHGDFQICISVPLIKGYLLRQRRFYVSQNMYDHASHHVIGSILGVFTLFVSKSRSVFQQNFGSCHPKIYFELTMLLNLVNNVTG